jgi:NitT/TauT family transport system substrate-binding protein
MATTLASACGAGDDDADSGATKVRLALSTGEPAVGQAAYTSLPAQLGYWEDEGLDVTINGLDGSSAALQAVDSGQSDIAVAGTSALMLAEAADTDLEAYFTLITRSFQNPAVPEDSDIDSFAELPGKVIGVQSLESGTIPIIRGLVESEGGDPADLDFVAIGLGAEALSALRADRVDVLGLWDDRYAEIENLGEPLRVLNNDFAEALGFQVALTAKPEWLDENPEVAIGFARAIARASTFANENPEEAVRLHWEAYPASKPIGVDEDVALEQGVRALTARMENSQPVDGLWGMATDEQVQTFLELLVDSGTVPDSVQAEDLWTDEYIEKINDFDVAAVEEEAANS